MRYLFNNFEFDCEQQLLTRDGKLISLNEKPAQLLALFLREADKIHSKDDILAKVWPGRVVTEQVVFQNISYLRALFGNGAIKTFPKKGYQWQLPLEQVLNVEAESAEASQASAQVPTEEIALSATKQVKNKASYKFLFLAFLIASLLFSAWLLLPEKTLKQVQPQTVVSKANKQDKISLLSTTGNQVERKAITDPVFSQTLFDSPFSTWQKYANHDKELLLATRLYPVNSEVALRFHIQGAARGWHDYILAANQEQALSQLNQLIQTLANTSYFSIASNQGALAELTLLADKQPNHMLLNQQLIRQHFKLEELDKATAMLDQQLAMKLTPLRQGLLYLLKTEITMRNQYWSLAEQSVKQALAVFQALKQAQLESAALINLSWIHHYNQTFRQGMQVLNQATSKARSSQEPLLEFNAHIIQSFMASKAGLTELMHTQLDLARELMALHQLPEEHRVLIHYNQAWFAKSRAEQIPHYQDILDQPFSPQYQDYFYSASEGVRDAFIEQQDWQQALNSIKPWQKPYFQALTRAHIAYAQNHWQQGRKYATQAHQLAQVADNIKGALDAALLILTHQTQANGEHKLDTSEYATFIKQNATRRWLDQNRGALEKLNEGSD